MILTAEVGFAMEPESVASQSHDERRDARTDEVALQGLFTGPSAKGTDVDSKDAMDAAAMVAMEAGIGRGLINLGGDIRIAGHMLAQRGERRERSGR